MRDEDWACLRDWIAEVSLEMIPAPYQPGFVTLVTRLTRLHIIATPESIRLDSRQAYALGCMYIVSCYTCQYPLRLQELHVLCCGCYTEERIVDAIQALVDWMNPTGDTFNLASVAYRRNICQSERTVCDLVSTDTDRLLVRKRIDHRKHLPAYPAMIEVMVHYLLSANLAPSTNITRLVYAHTTKAYTDLYYDYVQTPMSTVFGTTNADTAHTTITSLLRGVQCMHTLGIAHRDLKGLNIHITPAYECMILDVGSAGYGAERHTVPVCTITHRSPDILAAEVEGVDYAYDGRCLDMWSVGILVVEVYLGPDPFGQILYNTTVECMLSRIHRARERILLKLRGRCTDAQHAMIQRCLDSLPRNRPSISELMSVY